MSQDPKMSVDRVDPFVSEPEVSTRFAWGVLAFLAAVSTALFAILAASAYQERPTAGGIWGLFSAITIYSVGIMILFIYRALTAPDEE